MSRSFVDIDDFKQLNREYGNIKVDQCVLPVFMRHLEAFAFARGYAYRMGGDEYAILLGNGQGATAAFDSFRQAVPLLKYQGVSDRLTVSIGLISVPPTLDRSDHDVLELANLAMRFAKGKGTNCLATYNGDQLTDGDSLLFRR